MAKVVCECGTSYEYKMVKDMVSCPVCGKNLWADEETEGTDNSNIQEESEEGLMYFDQIMISQKHNGVIAYCKECKTLDFLDLDKFDKWVDKKYAILRNNIEVICSGCGKEHKPRKILYKRKDSYAPLLPRCPACNSAMLKKISTGSKFLAAATIGMFALPYNSKTFECKDCGYCF